MAKVIKQFSGAPDGQSRVQEFNPGDTVSGELAAVAVREGWATEDKASSIAASDDGATADPKPATVKRKPKRKG